MNQYFEISSRLFRTLVIFILSLGFLFGCSDDEKDSTEFTEVIHQLDETQFFIEQDIMLKSATDRDKARIREHLLTIRNGFIRLQKDPSDDLGFRLVVRGLQEIRFYENFFLERDVARLTTLINNVNDEIHRVAKITGKDVPFEWVLYSYRFSEEVEEMSRKGFRSWPEDAWKPDWALNRPSIGVNGNRSAFFVTPTFDLADVRDPSFNIVHTLQISRDRNRPEAPWNRKYILDNAFKVYGSVDYVSGDPDSCDCTWVELDLGELPTSKDFHSAQSPDVSLQMFAGQKVTLAFYFKTDDPRRIGPHYINWDINSFQVKGSGSNLVGTSVEPPQKIYSYSFRDKDGMEPFVVLSALPEGNQWKLGGRGEQNEWVEINHFSDQSNDEKKIDSRLISPKLVVSEALELKLKLTEVINHPGDIDLTEFRILTSTDYDGGDVTQANWVEHSRKEGLEIPKKSWGDISTVIDLEGHQQGPVTVMIWMKSEASETVWEIKDLALSAKSGKVSQSSHREPPSLPGKKEKEPEAAQ